MSRLFHFRCELLLVLALATAAAAGYGGRLLTSMEAPQRFLGIAENCKSVSIPAKSECAQGLECNRNTGTCVPVVTRPNQMPNKPLYNINLQSISIKNKNEMVNSENLQTIDDKLQKQLLWT